MCLKRLRKLLKMNKNESAIHVINGTTTLVEHVVEDKIKVDTKSEFKEFCCERFSEAVASGWIIVLQNIGEVDVLFASSRFNPYDYLSNAPSHYNVKIDYCPFCSKKIVFLTVHINCTGEIGAAILE